MFPMFPVFPVQSEHVRSCTVAQGRKSSEVINRDC